MRAWVIGRRLLREQRRDVAGLALTLLTAPCFVVAYGAIFDEAPRPLRVALVGAEAGGLRAGIEALGGVVVVSEGRAAGEASARGGAVDAAVEVVGDGAVEVVGDASAPGFAGGAALVEAASARQGGAPVARVRRVALGRSGRRVAFDAYVPSLLVFACIMLVFSTAMAVAREAERGTLERLRMSAMRPVEYLAGVAWSQGVLGLGSVGLTFGAALALGFEVAGSLGAACAVLASLGAACVGVGVAAGSAARTVSRAFLGASVAMFVLMLFSGMVFPLPEGAALAWVPTAQAVGALRRVLALGGGWGDVSGALVRLLVAAGVSFGVGSGLFTWAQRSGGGR